MANFDDLFTTPAAPEPPSAPPQLTKEEYARLCKAAERRENSRLCLLLQTICGTGIRVSE